MVVSIVTRFGMPLSGNSCCGKLICHDSLSSQLGQKTVIVKAFPARIVGLKVFEISFASAIRNDPNVEIFSIIHLFRLAAEVTRVAIPDFFRPCHHVRPKLFLVLSIPHQLFKIEIVVLGVARLDGTGELENGRFFSTFDQVVLKPVGQKIFSAFSFAAKK